MTDMSGVRAAAAYLEEHAGAILEDLEEAVSLETPSDDKNLHDQYAAFAVKQGAAFDADSVEVLEQDVQGDHVLLSWGDRSAEKPVFIVGHFDTVWPEGTLARLPFRREGDRVYGPGTFDMKAGLVLALWAVRAYHAAGGARPIVFLMNSDEEIGSPSSRTTIEELARNSAFSLVPEPALDEGKLKTARRGLLRYRLAVTGKASHSGLAPETGVSAIAQLCRLALDVQALADREQATDVNIGRIEGGTRYNVVAAHAEAEVGVRMATFMEADRVRRAIEALRPDDPQAMLEVEGDLLWPPMERTSRVAALADQAMALAAELGFALGEGRSGGSSDGCHCASVGAAILDGLGPVGWGAHADDEHVLASSLPQRASLMAGLLATVDHDGNARRSQEEGS
jgi:glutamate carboxypeptidase